MVDPDVLAFEGPEELTHSTERAFQLLDATDGVAAAVRRWRLDAGCVQVYCPHTSCGLLVTEMEDGLHEDLESLLDRVAPVSATYAHDDMFRRYQNLEPDERRNGWSHVRAALVTAPVVTLPVAGGELALGRWQRLFLVELDGPRSGRRLVIQGWGRLRRTG